jgi:8-oxo-dGTP pyrophosphatase MutT (NUDIX family)
VLGDLGRSLDGIHDDLGDPGVFRFAAVIGVLIGQPDDPSLVLIERSGQLRQHAGQLAFPGGKPEPGDRDLLDTALREAWEEVGLPREIVRVIGRLSPVPTPTGYMIVPFVGRVDADWQPQRASGEVERVLTPSLRTLMDPEVHRATGSVEWGGKSYELHEFRIAEPPLWGATARMVWDLIQRIRG